MIALACTIEIFWLISTLATPAAEPIRVACVGDSITAGVGTEDPLNESYPAQLQLLLGDGYRVGNFGHSGATLTRNTTRPYWSQTEFTKAQDFKPQVVVIMLGTNDAVPVHWSKMKDEFVPTLKELVASFRELASKPKVYVCLPVPSFESRKVNIETGVIPLVRQACREADVPIIDLFNPIAGREELFPDRLHPNSAGAALMAAIVNHAISDPATRKKNWRLVSADSEETAEGPAAHAIDGRADTYWHTAYSNSTPKHPHELVIDLGAIQCVFGVSCLPRQIGVNGRIRDYEIFGGMNASNTGELLAKGQLSVRADEEFIFFKKSTDVRYLTFRALSEVNGGPWTSLAELDVLIAPPVSTTQPATTAPATTQSVSAQVKGSFEIGEENFLLDGRPFIIRSGEMHAARVPREYWRHRLEMIRAMGCNTVCAYLFWNQHEPRPGEFCFSGQADAAEYCRLAQQVGLKVILRPGPYSCAEWDLGGLPWWLLKHADIKLRSRDPRYLEPAKRYLERVGRELAPLQITRGGPIIMVQVENEYGSYGDDKEYIGALRDSLLAAGFEVPLFTCDGPSQLKNDTRDDLFCVVNFGGDPAGSFKSLRDIRPKGPLMCGEYYPGWFDSWGRPHHTGDSAKTVGDLKYVLEHDASFSIYMVHGGTSFGFSSGANSPPFSPQSTSYDYDAPIDEAGRATPKYHALRELFSKHMLPDESLTPVPPPNPVITIPPIRMSEAAALMNSLGVPRKADRPLPMESLDQSQGFILYRTSLPAGPEGSLVIDEVHDYAQVYLEGRRIGVLDRRFRAKSLKLPNRAAAGRLDILVEAMGRVNYGGDLHDRKGTLGGVEWRDSSGVTVPRDWQVFPIPLDEPFVEAMRFQSNDRPIGEPAIYRGRFELAKVGDTFLDMHGWEKGMVWVNGHNLGRYWNIGPQQTLYLPGCWLKSGSNEILILDVTGGAERLTISGLDAPILNEIQIDPNAPKLLRLPGETLSLLGKSPVYSGRLADESIWQTVKFQSARGRFICLEVSDSQRKDPFTTCAEVIPIDEQQKPISMTDAHVVYADSEEIIGEGGSAQNVIDGIADSYWHTEWQAAQPAHPHHLVIDLCRVVAFSGIRILPRQDSPNGRIGTLRVFISLEAFPTRN